MEINNKINLKTIKINNKGEEKTFEKRLRIDKIFFEIESELTKKDKHNKNYYLLEEDALNILLDISKQLEKELIVINTRETQEGIFYQFNFKDEKLVFQETYSDVDLTKLVAKTFVKRQLANGKDFECVVEGNNCQLKLVDPITEEMLVKIFFNITNQKLVFQMVFAYDCEEYIKNIKFITSRLKVIKKFRYNKKNNTI